MVDRTGSIEEMLRLFVSLSCGIVVAVDAVVGFEGNRLLVRRSCVFVVVEGDSVAMGCEGDRLLVRRSCEFVEEVGRG